MISLKRWRYTFLTYFLPFQSSSCVQPCLIFWFGFHSILFCTQFNFWCHKIIQTHFLLLFMKFETRVHELISRLLDAYKPGICRKTIDWYEIGSTLFSSLQPNGTWQWKNSIWGLWYNPFTEFEEWIERDKKCIQEKSFRNILDALTSSWNWTKQERNTEQKRYTAVKEAVCIFSIFSLIS